MTPSFPSTTSILNALPSLPLTPSRCSTPRGVQVDAQPLVDYSSYLNSADPDEFDGNERAMYAAYCRMSSEFLPVGEFFAARRAHTEDEMAKELDDVRGRLGGLEVAVGRLADSFQREMRKMRERMPNNSAGNGLGHHMSRPSRTGSDISLEEVQESPSSTLDGARTLLPPQPPVSNGSSGGAVQ
eukprot:520523-Rhodomonas_salina.2